MLMHSDTQIRSRLSVRPVQILGMQAYPHPGGHANWAGFMAQFDTLDSYAIYAGASCR
jgi:hypothetical protein